MSTSQAIVFAAGKGSRMQSEKHKILHEVGGITIASRIVKLLDALEVSEPVFVVGYKKEDVEAAIRQESPAARFVEQKELLGTGDALRVGLGELKENGSTFVLMGDHPFYTPETLNHLLKVHEDAGAVFSLVTHKTEDVASYGQIVRDDAGKLKAIREAKDPGAQKGGPGEVNLGCYVIDPDWAREALKQIPPNPENGEYYLTLLIEIAYAEGKSMGWYQIADYEEALGINSQEELARAEAFIARRAA